MLNYFFVEKVSYAGPSKALENCLKLELEPELKFKIFKEIYQKAENKCELFYISLGIEVWNLQGKRRIIDKRKKYSPFELNIIDFLLKEGMKIHDEIAGLLLIKIISHIKVEEEIRNKLSFVLEICTNLLMVIENFNIAIDSDLPMWQSIISFLNRLICPPKEIGKDNSEMKDFIRLVFKKYKEKEIDLNSSGIFSSSAYLLGRYFLGNDFKF